MRDRAKRLGLVLGGTEIKQAEALTDAFYELGQVIKMTFVKLGAALGPTLVPLLTGLAEGIADITKQILDLAGGLTVLGAQIKLTLVEMLLAVVENIADIFNKLPGGIGRMFGAIVAGLKVLRTAAQKDLGKAQRSAQDKSGGDADKIAFSKSGSDQFKLELGRGTPEPVSTTGILSGFAAAQAASMGFNRPDPKKEEKEMVRLLGDIADSGPLLMEQ